MGAHDWYRSQDWNEEIAVAFESRYRRARSPSSKAQYLRIQGCMLIGTGEPRRVRAGIALTERMLCEFPDARTEIAMCWCQIGDGLIALGEQRRALDAYQRAWEFEINYPNALTSARYYLAVWIARLDLQERAAEAARIADEKCSAEQMFPIVAAQKSFVRAKLAHWRGDNAGALVHARKGLAAARLAKSPLRYHPGVGLVDPNDQLIGELEELARQAG